MLKRVAVDTVLYGLSTQAPKIVSIFVLPLLTPYLTRYDYGVFGLAMAYLGALEAFRHLGFGIVMGNSFFKRPKSYQVIWKLLHGMMSAWALIFSLLCFLVLIIALNKHVEENIVIVATLLCIPGAFFDPTNFFGFRYFQLKQQPLIIFYNALLTTIVTVSLNVYTIYVLKLGYIGWLISLTAGAAMSSLYFGYYLYFRNDLLPILRFRWRLMKRLLRISGPTIPHHYSGYLLDSADRLLLDVNRVPTTAIGLYNVGYSMANYFSALQMSIGYVIGPLFLKHYSLGTQHQSVAEQKNRYLTFIWQVVCLTGAFIISLWLREIYALLFRNAEFSGAYTIGIIVIMAYTYRPFYVAAIQRAYYLEHTGRVLLISLGAGMLNIVLNLILIPSLGIYAAAISTFVAFLYMGFAGFYLPSIKNLIKVNYYPFFWLLLIISTTAIAYTLKDAALAAKMLVTFTTLTLAAIVTCRYSGQLSAIGKNDD